MHEQRRGLRGLLYALLLVAMGCSTPDESGTADTAGDAVDAAGDGIADAGDDATLDAADTGTDAGDAAEDAAETDVADADDALDVADTSGPPVACGAEEACNRPLDAAGLCAGACLPQPRAPHCPRAPLHGLCHPEGVAEPSNVTVTVGDVEIWPVEPVAAAKTGDVRNVVFALRRKPGLPAGGTASVTVQGVAGKHWTLWGIGQGQSKTVEVGDTPVYVTVVVRAVGWDLYDHIHEMAVLMVDGSAVPAHGVLSYAGPDAIACGGFSFPPTLNDCDGGGSCAMSYPQGRCCGEVFYPSAACCVDTDCPTGVCADGRCIRRIPDNHIGRSMIAGHVRVLWVVANEPGIGGEDLCTDRTAELAGTIGLAKVEQIIGDIVAARLGANPDLAVPLTWQWKVLAGLHETSLDPQGEPKYDAWRAQVEAALQAKGCADTDFADYDIVVLSRPKLYLEGFAGHVYPGGFVGLRQIVHPELTAHELMHTFGASDLYGDIAVALQWNLALMGTNTYGTAPITDDVTWAEVGLGDVDRNGVVDLVQFASAPEQLTLAKVGAVLDKGPTLYIRADVGATEAGVERSLYYDGTAFTIELVAAGESKPSDDYSHTAAFDGAALDKAGVAIGAKVKVRVHGSHTFTGAGFVRKTLSLDQTLDVQVQAP